MNFLSRGIGALVLRRITGMGRKPGASVDPSRFQVPVKDPACLERIRGILTAFFSGVGAALGGEPCHAPGNLRRSTGGEPIDPLFLPFFEEGFAMGFIPGRHLILESGRASLRRFEQAFGEGDPFRILRHVGLGFWLGFRHARRADRMERSSQLLEDGRLRHLIHDGYGFKVGFFDLPRLGLDRFLRRAPLRSLEGFARYSAFHGLGRSLWFLSMDAPAEGFRTARFLGQERDTGAIIGGMGLAAAFTFVDDLSRAYGVEEMLAGTERQAFLKGIRIALYVRASADRPGLDRWLQGLRPDLRTRASADLARSLRAGKETESRDDFVEAFHSALLDPAPAP